MHADGREKRKPAGPQRTAYATAARGPMCLPPAACGATAHRLSPTAQCFVSRPKKMPGLRKATRACFRRAPPLFLERYLLDAPVGHLADQQFVLVAAVDGVRESELLQLPSGRPEFADDLAVERHLQDGGIFHPVLVDGVGDV